MLNEYREYEQLTCPLDGESATRFHYDTLKPDLSGLNRAMTILARGILFDGNNREATVPKACAETFLRAWCGHIHKPVAYRLVDKDKLVWAKCDARNASFAQEHTITNCLEETIKIESPGIVPANWIDAFSKQFPYVCNCSQDTCNHGCKQKIRAIENWFVTYINNLRKVKLEKFKEQVNSFCNSYKQDYEFITTELETTLAKVETSDDTMLHPVLLSLPKPTGKGNAYKLACEQMVQAAKVVDNATRLLQKMNGKRAQFSKNLFRSAFNDSSEYSLKEITYERVITNALLQGPLQVRYLVCKMFTENSAVDDALAATYKGENKTHIQELAKDLCCYLDETGYSAKSVATFIESARTDKVRMEQFENAQKIGKKRRQISFDDYYALNKFKKAERRLSEQINAEKQNIFKTVRLKEKKEKELATLQQEKLLRIVAVYLLGQTGKEGHYHNVVFNSADFSHWIQADFPANSLEMYMYNETDLFTVQTLRNNTIKLGINQTWLTEKGFALVSQLPQNQNCIVFSDDHSEKYLEAALMRKKE